jgi:hypothetical protein
MTTSQFARSNESALLKKIRVPCTNFKSSTPTSAKECEVHYKKRDDMYLPFEI